MLKMSPGRTAARSSPTLTFEFHLPEPVLAQHPSITLRARANGQELPPATYNTLGLQTYTARLRSVPAESLVVEFELDRCIGPSDADPRELEMDVLRHGENVEVVEPAALRAQIRRRLAAAWRAIRCSCFPCVPS